MLQNSHFVTALLSVALAARVCTASAAEERHPNVIVIFTDDMGYGDITCNGKGAGIETPNIDRIAKDGARFTQYYAGAPICSPSRAAILTGQFPGRNRLNSYLQTRAGNHWVDQNDFLTTSAPTMARSFKKAGYKTAHFGKWHMGGGRDVDNAPSIAEYGFDEFGSTWESPDRDPALGVQFPPWDKRKEPQQVDRWKRTEHMVNRTLDFLRRNKETPCFINLWPDDMHTPYWPSPEMMKKYEVIDDVKTPRKAFHAVLDEYDRQIGRLLDGLKEIGADKDTIVVFTSDNGPAPHFEHERNQGLRGMKLSLYEGGIRMPFLVQWPGHVKPGYVDESSVLSGLDMHLTLCAMAGVPVEAGQVGLSDGEDRSAVLLGKPSKRKKKLFWEYGRTKRGHARPRDEYDKSPNLAVREDEWKILVNDDGTSGELYNIVADPFEKKNIAQQNKEIVDRLSKEAIAWRKALPGRLHEGESTATAKLPNVILIVADDLGYGDVSPNGSKDSKTPNLEILAREGVRFTSAYVPSPICGPSRVGLLTGRYPQRFGFENNNGPEVIAVPQYGLTRDVRIMPEYLKEAGYVTGMVGKWHLGFKPELTPTQRGFDFFFGFHSGYHGYFPDQPAPWSGPIMRGTQPVEEKEYLTDAFAREALSFIDQNSRRPFFLYLPFNAVHSPLQVPKEIEDRFTHVQDARHRKTLAMMAVMDDAIGRVNGLIHEKHIFDGTIIIFVSDNGAPVHDGSNGQFRGGKGTLYEGGVRVPMIVKWWGHLDHGSVYDRPVSTLDILPTIFAAAGVPMPEEKFDGVNLLPYLLGENNSAPHETLFWRFNDKQKRKAIRHHDWKMVSEGGPWELYNLQNDLVEKTDVAGENAETVKQMNEMWENWNGQMQEPKWQGQAPPPGPDPSQQTNATASR